ncbi:MAG: DUF6077 domain-containing protein, partial [Proteobacteria bacterium]|nr:DUF6077 domain-containing protein [Pseudomonadota bacterium]
LVAGGAAWVRFRPAPAAEPQAPPTASPAPSLRVRIAVAAAAVVAVVSARATHALWPLWCFGAVLAALAWRERTGTASGSAPRLARPEAGLLALLALAGAALPLVAHRPDADDTFYVNVAAHAVDHPDAPLLARDTIHGLPDVPLSLPVYRVHALEPLAALVAWATTGRALDVAHGLVPALAGALLPLALAALLRRLWPAGWPLALLGAIGFLLASGAPLQSYANFGFVRLHQGKAILFSVLLPLLLCAGIDFGRRPSRRNAARLAATQIAAVGVSATALWLAPVVSGLAVVCALPWRVQSWRPLLAAAATSAYPVALGLAFASGTGDAMQAVPAVEREVATPANALAAVLGPGAFALAVLVVILASVAVAPTALARRVALVFPLAFGALFWNPIVAPWVAALVTGHPTYWRVFWILPVAAWIGLWIAAPARLRAPPLARAAAVAGLATLLIVWAPPVSVLSPRTGLFYGFPEWKIPPAEREAALLLRELAGAGGRVLAPPRVARWLPTLQRPPVPLVARTPYLRNLIGRVPDAEIERRRRLAAIVSGRTRPPNAGALLAGAVADDELAVVCLDPKTSGQPELRGALREAGLSLTADLPACQVWARSRDDRPRGDPG